jgi:tol-pal system beta propeller repeat protein TolB
MRVNWKHLAFALSALVVLVIVVAVASSGSDESDKPPSTSEAPSNGEPPESPQPSYVVSGSSNIYVIDVATRSLDQLSKNSNAEIAKDPSWSARGGIAFSEAPSGEDDAKLFIVKPDGSEEREVRTRISHLFQPTWAPDARKIALVRLGSGIYIVDLRTRSERRLSSTSEADGAPAWSHDGKTIVFERQLTATNWELYRVDATGGNLKRLTRDALQQTNPNWSPDGSRLVFSEQQRNGNWVVFSMKIDGSDRKRLTDERISSQQPSWSPDGERIAFIVQEGERASVTVIDADGGNAERITPRFLVAASHPAWSPDSKKIAFGANRAARPPPGPAPGG